VPATPRADVSPSSAVAPPEDATKTTPVPPSSTQRPKRRCQRPHSKLKAVSPLDDAEYGEHAAAFLSGNFQPLTEETTAVLVIRPDGVGVGVGGEVGILGTRSAAPCSDTMLVIGDVPADFPDGQFIYVGPNPKFPREHYKDWGKGPGQRDLGFGHGWHHWFEGDGMVYAMDFEGSEVAQRSGGSAAEVLGEIVQGDDVVKTRETSRPAQGDWDEVQGQAGPRRLRYRNRYVRTKSWHDELRHGSRLFRPLMNTSGTSFLPNAVANLFSGGDFLKDSANTALTSFAGRLLALQDTMPPWELDSDTLETKGACDFDGMLPFYVPFTAHPKVAPGSGELVFFGFNPVYPPHCSVGSVDPNGFMGPITSLWHNALHGATFMHDFCVTEHYTVLFEGSMNIRPLRMLNGQHPLQYDPSQMARFGVMRRDYEGNGETLVAEDIAWCDCGGAEMVYHFVNAWEDDATGEIVVVGVREDGFFHGALSATGTREWITSTLAEGISVPRMHEWRIDTVHGAVTSQRWLSDDLVEVPRMNDAFAGVQNRFAYAGRIHTGSLANDAQLKFDAVVKFDITTGTTQTYEHGEGRYGMEAQFVPRKRGCVVNSDTEIEAGGIEGGVDADVCAEDDGWLVMYVHDESRAQGREVVAEGRSECVVLDARNIVAGPVARVMLPSRVPYGAHALWCPAKEPAAAARAAQDYNASETRVQCGDRSADLKADNLAAAAAIKASPPKPRMFAVSEGQLGALLCASRTSMLRAAAGLFVNGWRPWLGADDAEEYAFFRAFGVRFAEARTLGTVREAQAQDELSAGYASADTCITGLIGCDLPAPTLTLYELEGCGGSRRAREAITMLDLACMHRPCPHGAVRNRSVAAIKQLRAQGVGGIPIAEDAQLPYLEDARTGINITGADAIVDYLYAEYLDGASPSPLVAPGLLATVRAQAAVDARGGGDCPNGTGSHCGPAGAFYSKPSRAPQRPLELWAYEVSPFCAVVREALCELEIPYVLRPCSRGSPRRTQLMRRTGGTFQVPYLEDPNTGVAMFESAAIVEYLRKTYTC